MERNSSVVRRTGTTSKHIAIRQTSDIPQRRSLPPSARNTINNSALYRKSRDHRIEEQETIRLSPRYEELREDEIPIYSRKSDHLFKGMLLAIGMALSILLLFAATALYNGATYKIEHFRYGERPMTHVQGFFGLPGETAEKQSYAVAMNQNGSIVVLIVPPDASQTKIYQLPQQYQGFSLDTVPYITLTTLQGTQVIHIVAGNDQWYLVRKENAFMPAQI